IPNGLPPPATHKFISFPNILDTEKLPNCSSLPEQRQTFLIKKFQASPSTQATKTQIKTSPEASSELSKAKPYTKNNSLRNLPNILIQLYNHRIIRIFHTVIRFGQAVIRKFRSQPFFALRANL